MHDSDLVWQTFDEASCNNCALSKMVLFSTNNGFDIRTTRVTLSLAQFPGGTYLDVTPVGTFKQNCVH